MKTVTIYFTADRKSYQRVTPSDQFKGDWDGLVNAITNGNHHSYKIV